MQLSHVLQAISLEEKWAKGTIRISLSKHNTIEDINYIADMIAEVLA